VAGKHGPISLEKCLEIHGTAMLCLEGDKGYVLAEGDGLSLERTEIGYLLSGRVGRLLMASTRSAFGAGNE
jgi:hypothetical protein